jgi:arylsulfatase A
MKRGALILFCLAALIANSQQKQPNIILIIADDLGYGDLGCYGQQKIETPHIDKLAKGGMRFTQFYSGSTVCAPSRASLMTGLHTGHTAVRGNKGTKPEGQTPLPDSVVTIANVLQQQGYNTAAFGKWGLGYITTSGAPSKKGFDQFFGYNCQSLAHDYYPDHLWDNDKRLDFPGNLTGDSMYSGDLIHQQAIAFLNAKHAKPFFAFLPYTLPHGDVIAPHDSVYNYYIKKFNEQPLAQRPANYSNTSRTFEPYPHAAFAAMVSRLDKYVGEIVATLKKNGTLGNTLILFTSDNGPHRENGGDPEYFDGNGIYRGIKRDLYEGGIRVPFIAFWEGTIKAGKEPVADIAALWDLYPTFQELAGGNVSKTIDGISMTPVLFGKGKRAERDYLYWEFHEQNGRQAILYHGEWKGIRQKVNTDANSPIELYNLKKDPAESNNVAAGFPAIVKKIETMMKEAHMANTDWPLLAAERKE